MLMLLIYGSDEHELFEMKLLFKLEDPPLNPSNERSTLFNADFFLTTPSVITELSLFLLALLRIADPAVLVVTELFCGTLKDELETLFWIKLELNEPFKTCFFMRSRKEKVRKGRMCLSPS